MQKNIEKIYVDQGLRKYFMNIYQYIGVNLALAGAVAFAISSNATLFNLIVGTPLFFVVMFAPIGIVLYMNSGINSFSINKLQGLFWLYGASVGASLSSIFVVYSMENIFRCFFMASAVFLSASIYGRVTSKDLSSNFLRKFEESFLMRIFQKSFQILLKIF
jgi:FtsH-binding integral membrane protein